MILYDEFREQLPISPADSIENYQITPLTYFDEQNKIIETFDNALPIEYHAWEKSIIYHSNMINLSKTEETGWIPTRDCRTLATYQKEILSEFNIFKFRNKKLSCIFIGHQNNFMENIRFGRLKF
ncbi:unnamed protein product [Adineta steineri]|uniref:Uncharacterized protein n=1 Tax=Adineta steineri TaxID=433720 RepID=A0A813UNA7_9BILA|nr:unnamed protein product [Adineta steineri]